MYGYGGVPGAPGNVGGVNLDSGVVSGASPFSQSYGCWNRKR